MLTIPIPIGSRTRRPEDARRGGSGWPRSGAGGGWMPDAAAARDARRRIRMAAGRGGRGVDAQWGRVGNVSHPSAMATQSKDSGVGSTAVIACNVFATLVRPVHFCCDHS